MNAKLDMMGFYKFIQDKREGLKSNSFDGSYLGSEFDLYFNVSNLNALEREELKANFLELMTFFEQNLELGFTEIQYRLWLYETELYNSLNIDKSIIADILRERFETVSFLELIELFIDGQRQPSIN